MKSITKKSVAGLLAVALLLGTIFATMPFFNVQAEDTVNRPVLYPAITSSNTINTKVVFLDIPSSITTEEEIINYLTSIGILKELSEYQKINSTVQGITAEFKNDNGTEGWLVKLIYGQNPTPSPTPITPSNPDESDSTSDNTPSNPDESDSTSGNVISVNTEEGTAVVYDKVAKEQRTIKYEQVVNGYIYRMYDASRGEHFYTKNVTEKDALIAAGWTHESESDFNVVGAEETDAIPVYRLYNPHDGGMHFYTENADEATYLDSIGWDYEGISHYVYSKDSSMGMPQYRLSNPNSTNGEHNWTTNVEEYSMLKAAGWIDEGICWKVVG